MDLRIVHLGLSPRAAAALVRFIEHGEPRPDDGRLIDAIGDELRRNLTDLPDPDPNPAPMSAKTVAQRMAKAARATAEEATAA